jgi:hypothetical protein
VSSTGKNNFQLTELSKSDSICKALSDFMNKLIIMTFILIFTFPAYAEDKQSPKAYSDEDLEQIRSYPDAVFPDSHETIEQYLIKKEQEEHEKALEDIHYKKQAIEIERICREETRYRANLQQQEDIKEEIEILRGDIAVQKYGEFPGAKIGHDQTRKRFSSQDFYINCIKESGLPLKYFGLDH